jgi:hypothetical protein
MRKRSKKKLLFDVLSGIDAAAKGGAQGYMAGQQYKADLESQKLKDLLTQANIDALTMKEEQSRKQNALKEEQLSDALQTIQSHEPSLLERSPPIIKKNIKKLTGLTIENPEYEQAMNFVASERLKAKGISDNKENRSHERTLIEKDIKKETPKEAEDENLLSSTKALLTRNPLDPQTYKNMASVALKTPGRLLNMAMKAMGSLDEKMAASKEKQGMKRISPSLAEELEPSIEAIEKGNEKIDRLTGGDPKAKENEALDFAADVLTPLPGASISRGGKALPRLAKNIGKGAATGGLYGALYGEGDVDAIKSGALVGGALHGAIGSKTPKVKSGKYDKLKKSSRVKDPEDIEQMKRVFGEDAEIQDLVDSDKFINKATKERGQSNINRMDNMLENAKTYAENIEKQLPQTKSETIYKDLSSFKKSMTKEKDRLFNAAKDVNDGVLNSSELKEFWNGIKKGLNEVKTLPKMKKTQGNINPKYLEKAGQIVDASKYVVPERYPRGYKSWYGKNSNILPTVEDVIEYRSEISELAKKATDSSRNTYINLLQDIDAVLEKIGSSAKTKEAREWFAKNYSSLRSADKSGKGTNISQAIDKFNTDRSTPDLRKLFGSNNIEEGEQVFKQLTPDQKLDVLGNMFHSIKEEKVERKVAKFFNELPDYIKKTNDKKIKSLLKDMEALALPNAQSNITRYQGATSENIGSRKVNRGMKTLMGILLGGSNPGLALGYGGFKAGKSAYNKKKWAPYQQKFLEEYLNPSLVKESKMRKSPELKIALRTQKQKEEENNDN